MSVGKASPKLSRQNPLWISHSPSVGPWGEGRCERQMRFRSEDERNRPGLSLEVLCPHLISTTWPLSGDLKKKKKKQLQTFISPGSWLNPLQAAEKSVGVEWSKLRCLLCKFPHSVWTLCPWPAGAGGLDHAPPTPKRLPCKLSRDRKGSDVHWAHCPIDPASLGPCRSPAGQPPHLTDWRNWGSEHRVAWPPSWVSNLATSPLATLETFSEAVW